MSSSPGESARLLNRPSMLNPHLAAGLPPSGKQSASGENELVSVSEDVYKSDRSAHASL